MVLNKRGVFFTIASILFVAALILLFTGTSRSEQIDTATIVVQTTNSLRQKLELSYMPAVLSHYGYLVLNNLSTSAYSRGVYLVLPADFTSAAMNGTYKGTGAVYVAIPGIVTLPQAFTNLTQAAGQIGYNLTIVVNSINITQSNAWQAAITANVSYNLSSQDRSVTFRETVITQNIVSLLGVPDLYYNRNENARGWNDYRALQKYQSVNWNNTVFAAFAASKAYVTDNQSPSFFQRLQNQPGPSLYGVETLIPTAVTPSAGNTSLDWQYFRPVTFSCTYNGSYASLRLDINATIAYNITGTSIASGGNCAPGP